MRWMIGVAALALVLGACASDDSDGTPVPPETTGEADEPEPDTDDEGDATDVDEADDEGDEVGKVDDQITQQIYDETDCGELAEAHESRTDDLAEQAADPNYGMSNQQVELIEERVAAAEERMAELDC